MLTPENYLGNLSTWSPFNCQSVWNRTDIVCHDVCLFICNIGMYFRNWYFFKKLVRYACLYENVLEDSAATVVQIKISRNVPPKISCSLFWPFEIHEKRLWLNWIFKVRSTDWIFFSYGLFIVFSSLLLKCIIQENREMILLHSSWYQLMTT